MKDVIPPCTAPSGWKPRVKGIIKLGLIPLTLLLRRRLVARYLASEPQPKLHVGCSRHLLPGWLNTDLSILNRRNVVYLDARKRLPFPDHSFSFIFSEHFISHLTLPEGFQFFRECLRVLRTGGVLRTATLGWPFLARVMSSDDAPCREYVKWATDEIMRTGHYSRCLVVNNLLYGMRLRFIYDPECLGWALSRAGFSQIVPVAVGQSSHPELRGVEGHGNLIPPEFNELETFVLEATKA